MDSTEWVAAAPVAPVSETPAVPVETPAPAPAASAPPPTSGGGAAQVAEAAKAAGATAAEAALAVRNYLEAQLPDGKTLQIPKDARIPWSQRGQDGFATIEDIRKAHLFHRDYTQKMQRHSVEREAFAREREALAREQVANEARWKAQERERQLFLDAQRDPNAAARLERHLEAMEADPEYARRWEKALDADVYEAVQEHEDGVNMQGYAERIATDARAYVQEVADKYPGVDAQGVLAAYQQAWFALDTLTDPNERTRRQGELTSSRFIDGLFKQEAAQVDRVTAPIRTEMTELKNQLAALLAERDADKTNGQRAAHRERTTRAVVGAPVAGGAPAAPVRAAPTPYLPEQREERIKQWVNAG